MKQYFRGFKFNPLKSALILLVVGAILFLAIKPGKPQSNARNVILIIADALRSNHLGCYGYNRGITPNLDNLAKGGILFENSVAQSGWTKPAYSALITANHPTSIGITGMNDGLIDNITTAAEVFKENGFYTAAFITNPYLKKEQGFAQGFDEYHHIFPKNLSEYKVRANELNEKIFTWLEKNKEKKFFLLIFYLDPHTPYAPLPPYDTLFAPVSRVKERDWQEKIANPSEDYLTAIRNLYDGEIAFMDKHIGRLFSKLVKMELWDESLIVFTADHGEEFYDHQWWQHNHTLFDELLKVPLIFHVPGVKKGIRVKPPVQHIEVIPTLFDLLGMDQWNTFTGKSALDLIKNPEKEANKLTFHETHLPHKRFISLRGTRWKIIQDIEKNSYQFYDLQKDPKEKNNLLVKGSGIIPPGIQKEFRFFQSTLSSLSKQAYQLRHKRRAFKKVRYDERSLELLQGLGYTMQ